MPMAAKAMDNQIRTPIRSLRKYQLISAETAGMAAKMTPADTALVMLTPKSMQIEKRKFPKKDSKNKSPLVRRSIGSSDVGFFSHPAIATAAIPKRSQANKKTGIAATRGLESAT
jgi:hypothetical protein